MWQPLSTPLAVAPRIRHRDAILMTSKTWRSVEIPRTLTLPLPGSGIAALTELWAIRIHWIWYECTTGFGRRFVSQVRGHSTMTLLRGWNLPTVRCCGGWAARRAAGTGRFVIVETCGRAFRCDPRHSGSMSRAFRLSTEIYCCCHRQWALSRPPSRYSVSSRNFTLTLYPLPQGRGDNRMTLPSRGRGLAARF